MKLFTPDPAFAPIIRAKTGVKYEECYQCGKCSAGCQMAYEMDILPHQIVRLVQVGREEVLLKSNAIWMCLSCHTCVTRCPNDINIPLTVDALRERAHQKGFGQAAKNTVKFHETFLQMVEWTGRLFEVGLLGMYKLRTRRFLQDLTAAPKMLRKLTPFPRRIKGYKEVAELFKKSREDQV